MVRARVIAGRIRVMLMDRFKLRLARRPGWPGLFVCLANVALETSGRNGSPSGDDKMRRSLFSISSFLALVALAGPFTPLVAQGPKTFRSGMNLGAGYVGVIPEAVVGGGVFYFFG